MVITRRNMLLLILAQTGCVAMGLWVHEHLLTAVAHNHLPSDIQSQLAASPLIASAVALLWTGALLAVVLYVTLGRCSEQSDAERGRAAVETLRQAENLVRTRDAVIFGLAKLADSRDPETGDHLERISAYSALLATALRRHPRFREAISGAFVKVIGISAALHDIGKVGVEDRILRKQGRLTKAERAEMQLHTRIGGDCLAQIERRLGSTNFLQMARQIALAHHERWDGAGYPEALVGEAIPLAARIVAVADVYDALSSRRIYKEPIGHETCVEMIRAEAGGQFDPDIVQVWLEIEPKFREIARQYQDPPAGDDGSAFSVATTSEGRSEAETPALSCEARAGISAAHEVPHGDMQ